MKIFVTAKAGAKRASIEEIDPTHFVIAVKEPATDNRANIAILKSLARHFRVPAAALSIASGISSSKKVFLLEAKEGGASLLP